MCSGASGNTCGARMLPDDRQNLSTRCLVDARMMLENRLNAVRKLSFQRPRRVRNYAG